MTTVAKKTICATCNKLVPSKRGAIVDGIPYCKKCAKKKTAHLVVAVKDKGHQCVYQGCHNICRAVHSARDNHFCSRHKWLMMHIEEYPTLAP